MSLPALTTGYESKLRICTVSKPKCTLAFASRPWQNIYGCHGQYSLLRISWEIPHWWLACQNESPAWPSPGLVCPGGRLLMRISLTVTAQLRDEQGMKGGGSLSSRNHSLAARAMGPTFNFKPRRSRSSHGPCTQRLFFTCGGEEWWVFTWSLLLIYFLKNSSLSLHSPPSSAWQEI